MNGSLSFKNGLSGPLGLQAEGVGTFKVRSLRGISRQKIKKMPSRQDFAISIECKNRVLITDTGFDGELSAPKSQRFLRFAIAMPIADPSNRAISETRESNAALRFKGAMESR